MNLVYILLVIFFLESDIYADKSEYTTPDALYLEAIKNNPILKSLKYKIKADKYSVESSKFLMEPRFKFEIQRLPATRPYDFMHTDMYMFGLEQEIILPQKIKSRSMIEYYELEKSTVLYNKAELDMELKIYSLFYKYHFYYNKERVLNEELNLLNQLRDIAKIRYTTSNGMNTDILKIDSEIIMIRNAIADNQYVIQQIVSEINYILSREPQTKINPPADYEIKKPEINPDDIKGLIRLRPEVKIAEIESKKKEEAKRLSKLSNSIPDLMLAGGYQLSPMMSDGLYFMVSLNIPWFSKKNNYEYLMKEEIYNESSEMYIDQLNMTATEIHLSLQRLNTLFEIISNLERIDMIKKQTFLIELSMYEKGQSSYEYLIETLRESFKIKLDYLSMKLEYIMTYSDLLRCCGQSVSSLFIKKEE
jgi:outer membrane protein TolC